MSSSLIDGGQREGRGRYTPLEELEKRVMKAEKTWIAKGTG